MVKVAKIILSLLADAYAAWTRDAAIQLGAAIAFYAALSLAPLLIFVFTLAGAVLGAETVEGELVTQTEEFVGHDAAITVGSILQRGYTIPTGTGLAGSVAGLVSLVLGASVLFWQVKRALNTVWGIRRHPQSRVRGLLDFIQGRLLSAVMVIGVGALLLLSAILDTSLSALRQWISAVIPESGQEVRVLLILQVLKFVMSFSLITFAITIVYKTLPDADVKWKDAWIGANVTSLMLSVGNLGIGWYLATWSFRLAYGTAASLLAFLIWIYFSAQVFFFGAEFTQVYANKYGSGIIPHKNTLLIIHRRRTHHDLADPEGVLSALEEALAADEAEVTIIPQASEDSREAEDQIRSQQYKHSGTADDQTRRTLRYGGMLAAATALAIGAYYGFRRISRRPGNRNKIKE